MDGILDDVDRGILYLLQQDARNNTTAGIGERVGVSSTTVGNRIDDLESENIITGYNPTIDYENAGLDHHLVVTGSVPMADRSDLADDALQVHGVVTVRELLTHRKNLELELVARERQGIEAALDELAEMGIEIVHSEMLKRELNKPADHFGEDVVEDRQ